MLSRVRAILTDGDMRQARERVKFQGGAADQSATAEAAAPRAARETRINREHLEERGCDRNYSQCMHIIKYGKTGRGQEHIARIAVRNSQSRWTRRRVDTVAPGPMERGSTGPSLSRWELQIDRLPRLASQGEFVPSRRQFIEDFLGDHGAQTYPRLRNLLRPATTRLDLRDLRLTYV